MVGLLEEVTSLPGTIDSKMKLAGISSVILSILMLYAPGLLIVNCNTVALHTIIFGIYHESGHKTCWVRNMNFLIIRYAIIAAIIFFCFGCSSTRGIITEQSLDSTAVKNMVYSRSFVFNAQFVNPMTGRRRSLDYGYDVSISKDTLISYLPFFGRGYTAPLSPTDVDYDFTSTNFTYDVKTTRKGWSISIKPKDKVSLQELYFTIFDNGVARLSITSMNRSAISYDGHLAMKKEKRQK